MSAASLKPSSRRQGRQPADPGRPKPWARSSIQPRDWQRAALPKVLDAIDTGRRGVVSAFMGSGKSILLAEVVHQQRKILKSNEVIIVGAPRRRLVRQLAATIARRCGGRRCVGTYFTDEKQPHKRVIVCCYASAEKLAAVLEEQGRTVALLLCDEAHQTETDTLLAAHAALKPTAAVGFTATPFRASKAEKLSLFDDLIYAYTYVDALRDGVLVTFEVVNWDGTGDGEIDALCAEQISAHAQGPGIVSALSIADAEAYAEYLVDCGIDAAAIHSKLDTEEQDELIEELRTGELQCLVHVALLCEGVDLPWLRWICMRRPVGSKVRFVQELGRVLRVHPGKDAALVLDPHDLMGRHGITHPAALSDAVVEDSTSEFEDADEDAEGKVPDMPQAVAVGDVATYLRQILIGLMAGGVAVTPRFAGGAWHHDVPSVKQLDMLGWYGWLGRHLPGEHATALFDLTWRRVGALLTKAVVADLISVLLAIKADHDEWKRQPAHRRGDYELPYIDLDVPDIQIRRLVSIGMTVEQPRAENQIRHDVYPRASRAWLDRIPQDHQQAAIDAVAVVMEHYPDCTPHELCHAVGRSFAAWVADAGSLGDSRWGRMLDLLCAWPQEALEFSVMMLEGYTPRRRLLR